jgi:four helix bundle protein
MIGDDLRARSRQFALDVVKLCGELGPGRPAWLIGPQLFRAGTGAHANYRAACRSRSPKEFAARLAVCVEEADEAELWLDVLEALKIGVAETVRNLRNEAGQLRAIFAKSRSTTLKNAAQKKRRLQTGNREP